jgi:hypothetical protein
VAVIGRVLRGIGLAVRERPGAFVAVGGVVLALNVLLPPLVLSVARKPADYFTVNPWLRRLPEYLAAPGVPWATKRDKLWELALFWVSADSPYGGVEWGYAVDVGDLARILMLAALFGAYFVLWWRQRRGAPGWTGGVAGRGGVAGVLLGALGLSTGPCSVMGCGAPVIPVLGLMFVGLSSGTLALMARLSDLATTAVLVALVLGVAVLGWVAGAPRPTPAAGSGARRIGGSSETPPRI